MKGLFGREKVICCTELLHKFSLLSVSRGLKEMKILEWTWKLKFLGACLGKLRRFNFLSFLVFFDPLIAHCTPCLHLLHLLGVSLGPSFKFLLSKKNNFVVTILVCTNLTGKKYMVWWSYCCYIVCFRFQWLERLVDWQTQSLTWMISQTMRWPMGSFFSSVWVFCS